MEAQNPQGPAGLRGPFRDAGRRVRRAVGDLLRRGRGMTPRAKRALAVTVAAGVLLVAYTVLAQVSPEFRQWADSWRRGEPAPLTEVLDQPPAPGPATQGEPLPAAQPPDEQAGGEAAAPESPRDLLWPLPGTTLRGFGWGYDPTMGDYRYHPGVDVEAEAGQAVRAAFAGTVREVRRDPRLGWTVEVAHGPSVTTRYAGLGEVHVARGDVVERGQTLGTVGDAAPAESGQPPHLHFELIWDGQPIDPALILNDGS